MPHFSLLRSVRFNDTFYLPSPDISLFLIKRVPGATQILASNLQIRTLLLNIWSVSIKQIHDYINKLPRMYLRNGKLPGVQIIKANCWKRLPVLKRCRSQCTSIFLDNKISNSSLRLLWIKESKDMADMDFEINPKIRYSADKNIVAR